MPYTQKRSKLYIYKIERTGQHYIDLLVEFLCWITQQKTSCISQLTLNVSKLHGIDFFTEKSRSQSIRKNCQFPCLLIYHHLYKLVRSRFRSSSSQGIRHVMNSWTHTGHIYRASSSSRQACLFPATFFCSSRPRTQNDHAKSPTMHAGSWMPRISAWMIEWLLTVYLLF